MAPPFLRKSKELEFLQTDEGCDYLLAFIQNAIADDPATKSQLSRRVLDITDYATEQRVSQFKDTLDSITSSHVRSLETGLSDRISAQIGKEIADSQLIKQSVNLAINFHLEPDSIRSTVNAALDQAVQTDIQARKRKLLEDYEVATAGIKPDEERIRRQISEIFDQLLDQDRVTEIERMIAEYMNSMAGMASIGALISDLLHEASSPLRPKIESTVMTEVSKVAIKAVSEAVNASLRSSEVLSTALNSHLNSELSKSESELRSIVRNSISMIIEAHWITDFPNATPVPDTSDSGRIVGFHRRHYKESIVLKALNAGHIMMVGPAGSGKTRIAQGVAKALELPFFMNGAIQSEYKLLGFQDAKGVYQETPFYSAFVNGGVYLFDEIDASGPATLVAFNAALANGMCDFPGHVEPVLMHTNFRCLAAANTFGRGQNRVYVGRNQLDAATLDRFIMVEIDYDKDIELGNSPEHEAWIRQLHVWRENMQKLGVRHVISSRTCQMSAKLLSDGFDHKAVEEMVVWKGLDTETVKKITKR